MAWSYADLKAADSALSPAQPDPAQAAATLNAQTVTLGPLDTTGHAVRGLLYPRDSWVRVEGVAAGDIAVSAITPPSGYTATQIVTICRVLVGMANQDSNFAMSISAINNKVTSDIAALQGAKLASDSKGILWAAGELQTGDAGDAAAITATLVSPSGPKWTPTIEAGDIQTARAQP